MGLAKLTFTVFAQLILLVARPILPVVQPILLVAQPTILVAQPILRIMRIKITELKLGLSLAKISSIFYAVKLFHHSDQSRQSCEDGKK
jgi:hypothetical protein